jgi:hypothetical protein
VLLSGIENIERKSEYCKVSYASPVDRTSLDDYMQDNIKNYHSGLNKPGDDNLLISNRYKTR